MNIDVIETFSKTAGIAGLSVAVVFYLFRSFIRSTILSKLESKHAYKLIRLFLIFTFSIGVLGISAWLIYPPLSRHKERLSITVFVHGRNGRNDLILKEGNVFMDLNGERKIEEISRKGTAVFSNVAIGDTVKLGIDFTEPYYPIRPDSVYQIKNDSPIDLVIYLAGSERVHGHVLFNNMPLDNVSVTVGDLINHTDSLGMFRIEIPDSLRKDEYTVWFSKKGFKTVHYSAFPQTGQSLDINMQKE